MQQAVGEDEVLAKAVKIAVGLAGKDRRTLAEHKRLLYVDAIATLAG